MIGQYLAKCFIHSHALSRHATLLQSMLWLRSWELLSQSQFLNFPKIWPKTPRTRWTCCETLSQATKPNQSIRVQARWRSDCSQHLLISLFWIWSISTIGMNFGLFSCSVGIQSLWDMEVWFGIWVYSKAKKQFFFFFLDIRSGCITTKTNILGQALNGKDSLLLEEYNWDSVTAIAAAGIPVKRHLQGQSRLFRWISTASWLSQLTYRPCSADWDDCLFIQAR